METSPVSFETWREGEHDLGTLSFWQTSFIPWCLFLAIPLSTSCPCLSEKDDAHTPKPINTTKEYIKQSPELSKLLSDLYDEEEEQSREKRPRKENGSWRALFIVLSIGLSLLMPIKLFFFLF